MTKENVKGTFKYKMSHAMAKALLKERKGNEMKMSQQDYLKMIVDEQFGIMGKCIEVIID